MNFKIIFKLIFITSCFFILFISCSGGGSDDTGPTDKSDQTLFSAGEDQNKITTDDNFTQEATGVEGTGTTSYSSSDTDVATVDTTTGLVHIVGTGTTQITASNTGDGDYNPTSDIYLLTVRNPEFITTWKTDNIGPSDDDQITIPVYSGETYNYTVDWGDGNIETNVTGSVTHSYGSVSTYTVSIKGEFPRIYFNDSGDMEKIVTIEQWGGIKWTSMNNAFHGCEKMTYNAQDTPDLSGVTDMTCMFRDADFFTGDLNAWDVSKVTNMHALFASANAFIGDISSWDVSNVTDMYAMFANDSFNGDISGWDVNKVTDMSYMFYQTDFFNADISGWDVSSATNMESMFYEAFSFNRDLSKWNVSSVTDMSDMFNTAFSFSGHDLSGWVVTQVTDHTDFSTGWGIGNTEPSWP